MRTLNNHLFHLTESELDDVILKDTGYLYGMYPASQEWLNSVVGAEGKVIPLMGRRYLVNYEIYFNLWTPRKGSTLYRSGAFELVFNHNGVCMSAFHFMTPYKPDNRLPKCDPSLLPMPWYGVKTP